MKNQNRIILFCKENYWGEIVERFLKENFEDVRIFKGDWGDPFPRLEAQPYIYEEGYGLIEHFHYISIQYDCDYILSFCSPWIIPIDILKCAKKTSINFHPAPPKYPGIGGYNYAIYNQDREYGVTVHKMEEKVDTGEILEVQMFKLYGNETVQSLKEKTMNVLLDVFYFVINEILLDSTDFFEYGRSCLKWERLPYTRKEFQEFCNLDNSMDYNPKDEVGITLFPNELERKLQATYFPNALDPPYIKVNGKKWRLEPYEKM